MLDDLEKEASTGRMVNMEAIDVDAEIVDTNKKNKRRKTNSKAAEVLSQSDFSSAEDDFVLE